MDKFVVGPHRGWPGPHIVIEIFWRIGIRRVFPRSHMIVTADLDHRDFAKFAWFYDLIAGFDKVRSAPALGSDLDNSFVRAGRGEHSLPFGNIDADWVLNINIGASFQSSDHGERMPMIRRADEHHVQILFP